MSQDFGSGLLATIDYTSNRLRWSRVSHFFHADRLRQPSKRASPGFSDCWKSWHCPVSKGLHRHLSVPPPSLDLFAWLPRPIRPAPAAPGRPLGPVAPCFQTGAASDGSRPASTSSNGHASPTARPSSRAAARSSWATRAPTRASPGADSGGSGGGAGPGTAKKTFFGRTKPICQPACGRGHELGSAWGSAGASGIPIRW